VIDGVLVIDKPSGMTSHDVVDEVRRRLGTRRVGHGGTLDPDATGVLVVGVGRATRLLSYAQQAPKRYRAVATFGAATTTQDASGEVVARRPTEGLDAARVASALPHFVGTIEQLPPMVSAVKVGGRRLYERARRGEEVERRPRRVTVYALELVRFEPGVEPQATLDVRCSAGTYVRTLVHDLGEALGTGAHLRALRRIAAGGFGEDDALALGEVGEHALRPPVDVLGAMARVEVDAVAAREVRHGRALPPPDGVGEGEPVAIVHAGSLLGVYERRGGRLVAQRVMTR
jgi:tRNA pseudouridine55 synthase